MLLFFYTNMCLRYCCEISKRLGLSCYDTEYYIVFSSARLCQQSYCHGVGPNRRPSSVRRPLTQVSRKPLHGSRSNFMDSSLSTTSPHVFFFFFSKCSIYDLFFFIFVHMGPQGSKNFKTLLSLQF